MSVRPARPRTANRRRATRQPHNLAALRERSALISTLLQLPFLDPEQSALIGQTSASTIRRACVQGSLPHTRVNGGKLIRIAPDDLRAWLRSGNGLAKAS